VRALIYGISLTCSQHPLFPYWFTYKKHVHICELTGN
jgi:hypothetical protein